MDWDSFVFVLAGFLLRKITLIRIRSFVERHFPRHIAFFVQLLQKIWPLFVVKDLLLYDLSFSCAQVMKDKSQIKSHFVDIQNCTFKFGFIIYKNHTLLIEQANEILGIMSQIIYLFNQKLNNVNWFWVGSS